MRRMFRIAGFFVLGLSTLGVAALPFAVGTRPFLGPRVTGPDRSALRRDARARRARALPRDKRERLLLVPQRARLAGERLPGQGGTKGGGRVWDREGLPFLTAPNITPDRRTGAGTWTDDMLARAIREGIGHDGRTLFPVMPYSQYRSMSDEDLASLIVYLRTIPAVTRELPKTNVPFPVSRLINAVPEPIAAPVPQPDRRDTAAYGDYLTRMGACRDCHTPVDARNQPIADMEFSGGFLLTGPYGQVAARNLTPDPSGIPYDDADLFVEVMRTGMVKARKVHDAMPWARFAGQTDEDLRAIFRFLQTVRPVKHRVDNALPPTPCPVCGATHGAGDQNVPGSATTTSGTRSDPSSPALPD